jgi:phosphoribosylformimino-5-aminoimidazole carboxamide ribotide isomerase
MRPEALIRRLVKQGVKRLIYTDATRDGTLAGPAVEGLKGILKTVGGEISCFASGGISSLEDLVQLKTLESQGLTGVIVGRALYEDKVDLKAAVELCSPKGSSPVSTSRPAGSLRGSGSSP